MCLICFLPGGANACMNVGTLKALLILYGLLSELLFKLLSVIENIYTEKIVLVFSNLGSKPNFST